MTATSGGVGPLDVVCAVCAHPIVRYGSDWRCTQHCRCLMLGCVPDEGRPPVPREA